MTAQMNDSFLLEDKNFSVVGVNGSGLFNPLSYNMQPLPRITSCWRGYVCTYRSLHDKMSHQPLEPKRGTSKQAIENWIEPTFKGNS